MSSTHTTRENKEIDSTGYFKLSDLKRVSSNEGCQTLGLVIDLTPSGNISIKDKNRFLKGCKKIIESSHFDGFYELVEHPLLSMNKTTRLLVLDDSLLEKKNLILRALLYFSFKTTLSKEELEVEFPNIYEY